MPRVWPVIACLLAFGCNAPEEDHGRLGVSMAWLERGVARDIRTLRVTTFIAGKAESVIEANLAELEDDGRTKLALPDLPANTEIRVRIEGRNGARKLAYVGELGPLEIGRGETYRAQITMVPAQKSVEISGFPHGRFLHSAVRLRDGRVLIAGGFGAPEKRATCPEGLRSGSECYDLAAHDDAFVFDATSAKIFPLASKLLRARGGHTATMLGDGRVLIAGGAERALLILEAVDTGFVPRFVAQKSANAIDTPYTFEIFEPLEQDRDPRDKTQGSFVGQSADRTHPGVFGGPRFMHCAALNPAADHQVLLAGGSATETAATTVETFDAARIGGPGVAPGEVLEMQLPRLLPSCVGLGDDEAGWVWVFGGGIALDNNQLAERWAGNENDARGVLEPATESAFPNLSSDDLTPRPEYSLFRPLAVALSAGTHALVAGALGPRCIDHVPVYPSTSLSLDAPPCSDFTMTPNAFIVSADTGETRPISMPSAHVLGAAASLDDGRAALARGFLSLSLDAMSAIDVVTWANGKSQLTSVSNLRRTRALHTSTGLFGAGMLTVGGLERTADGLSLVPGAELVWF